MRSLRSAAGQTTTEYLMLSGFLTAFSIWATDAMGVPLKSILQLLVNCMINDTCK